MWWIMWLKIVFCGHCRCSAMDLVGCIAMLVSISVFRSIELRPSIRVFLLKIKPARRKILVLNSTTHMVCISYFYYPKYRNFADDLTVTERVKWVRDRNCNAIFCRPISLRWKYSLKDFWREWLPFLPRNVAFSLIDDFSMHRPMKRHRCILYFSFFLQDRYFQQSVWLFYSSFSLSSSLALTHVILFSN